MILPIVVISITALVFLQVRDAVASRVERRGKWY